MSSVSTGPRALLMLLCLALYLPGLTTIPPVDRDEARFAQATRQMLESRDFIRPHFRTDDRFKKPIGIYWLQSAAVLVTGQARRASIWAYRLPSVLGALIAVWLTHWVGGCLFDRRVGLLGASVLASSALLVVEAHQATTDAVLLACVVAAQGCLAALYLEGRRGNRGPAACAAGFWIAQGLGILVKGPIVPLVSGLTLATLVLVDRQHGAGKLPRLRCAWGVPLMLAIVLPWAVAVGIETQWAFYRDWIGGDLVPKIAGGHESHGAPPGFYLVLVGATFWPGSLALGPGVIGALRQRIQPGERFCLAWLIPTWVFFELMPTKLPHYVLPTYPALALLVARAVLALQENPSRLRGWRVGLALWGALTLVLGVGGVACCVAFGAGAHFAAAVAAVAAAVLGVLCTRLGWLGQMERASWAAAVGSVAVFAPLLHSVLPSVQGLWLSRDAAVAVAQQGGVNVARPLATVGYDEPSVVFLVDTDVTLLDANGAAAFLKARPDGLVLVSDGEQAAFKRAARESNVLPRQVWAAEGINYSKGRRTRLILFDQLPPAISPADTAR